jgi:hypothetical protein
VQIRGDNHLGRRAGATILTAALWWCTGAGAQTPGAGLIERLTAETHEQAIACGRLGAECAVVPYALCPSDGRYSARIATPFSRVASAVLEAIKAGRRPNPMTPGAATHWGVGIFVFPADNSAKADAIQRVEIRREGRIIQPSTSTVGPITVKVGGASTKQLARGFFAFPPDTFSPTANVTVVFAGAAGETTCTLDIAHLRSLR